MSPACRRLLMSAPCGFSAYDEGQLKIYLIDGTLH